MSDDDLVIEFRDCLITWHHKDTIYKVTKDIQISDPHPAKSACIRDHVHVYC